MEDNKQLNQEEYLELIEQWKKENKDDYNNYKVRKVFLECLPKWEDNRYKGKVKWEECENYKVYFIYENIEDYIKIINYNKNILLIEYNKKQKNINISHFKNCKLGEILMKRTKDFIYEIGVRLDDDKRDITITDRNTIKEKNGQLKKYYSYKCNKCRYSKGFLNEYNLKRGDGCPVCCNPSRLVVEGINDIPTTAYWMVKFFQGGYNEAKLYTCGSNQYIYPICPDCGKVRDKVIKINTIHKNHSIACTCSDKISIPNKIAYNILEQLKLDFIPEYSPNWIKPKRYDFYIPSMNLIIEMDGGLGHGNKVHSKEKRTNEELKSIDDYKDEQARLNSIEVIRINCNYGDEESFKFIKNNILNNTKLNKLFNLGTIDWGKCEKYICNNFVKIVSEYKKYNPNMNIEEISKIFKLGRTTINRYLKKGTKLGWCNYNPKEVMKEIYKRNEKRIKEINAKEVIMYLNNTMIGKYKSAHDIERKSEHLFGIKLSANGISRVCRNERNHYKGFTFKYTQDLTEKEIKQIQENAKLNQVI